MGIKTVTTIETMEFREKSTINSALREYGKPSSPYSVLLRPSLASVTTSSINFIDFFYLFP
jgi:hypothetical protein